MLNILVIEDSNTYAKLIKFHLEKNIVGVRCDIVSSFEELKNSDIDKYELFIVDMILIDSEKDHIDYLLKNNKKIILMTQYRDKFFKEKLKYDFFIMDYILKDDISILNYLKRIVKRFYKNRFLNVLVVEDSLTVRNLEKRYLALFNFNVFTAKDVKDAITILKKESINLIITDLTMPKISGEELIKFVREKYVMEELPIMVVSSNSEKDKLIEVLKLGVNDFLTKPFLKEEFLIRVLNIVDIYEVLRSYEDSMFKDGLTGVYNRLFLENKLDDIFSQHSQKSIVMIDIDFFKKINDTYGHQVGDKVLKELASLLKGSIRKNDFVIRYGGEEFLIYLPFTDKKQAYLIISKIKEVLKKLEKVVPYTFSAGIADEGETLAQMIKIADNRLYKAKKNGRNRIVYE